MSIENQKDQEGKPKTDQKTPLDELESTHAERAEHPVKDQGDKLEHHNQTDEPKPKR